MPDDTRSDNDVGGLIQSADLPEGGNKPRNKAIKDACMARDVVHTLIEANRHRTIVNSRIMSKYNAEKPYDQCKLESEGLGWRSNFTVKPLSALIERVHPRFSEAVALLKYVTNSSLSNQWENNTEKTEIFRAEFTKYCRSHKGWRSLLEDIALETTMFGSCVVAWTDEFSVFPKAYKQSEALLSDGTKQLPNSAQVVVLKETFLPHELWELVSDKSAAEAAGWNMQNVRQAINAASPAALRDNLGSGALDAWHQNAIRELSVGSSYQAGASVIVVYSLFAQELDGKVSHYRLGGDGLKELFSREDRFDSMDSCVSFFCYQKGNGTVFGSKGIGREAYEMCSMMDRINNETVDRLIMSGKIIFQGDPRNIHKFKVSVIGATCIVPNGWAMLESRVDGNTEPFLKLSDYFQQISDNLVGNVSPRVVQGERVTAAAVNLYASREEEGKDTRITRFLEFFTDMVSTIQKRACSKEADDDAAKAFQKLLLEKMTRKELDEIAEEPVAGTVRDLTPVQRQLIVSLAAEKAGNPMYNQRALQVADLTARIDQDFADRVLLPVDDPTESAEQKRLQQMEFALISQGQPVPVSPRDGHAIHMEFLMPMIEKLGAAIQAGEVGTAVFEAALNHLNDHLHAAQAQGVSKDITKPVESFLKKAMPILAQLHATDEQAEQLSAESEAHDAEGQQPPVPQ